MKEAFPGFKQRIAPDRPKTTVAEDLELRGVRIDKDEAIKKLEALQESARPGRLKAEEDRLRMIAPTAPV